MNAAIYKKLAVALQAVNELTDAANRAGWDQSDMRQLYDMSDRIEAWEWRENTPETYDPADVQRVRY